MATMAQLVYGSFIRVWREKEFAVKETRLKRLLLHDASHQGKRFKGKDYPIPTLTYTDSANTPERRDQLP